MELALKIFDVGAILASAIKKGNRTKKMRKCEANKYAQKNSKRFFKIAAAKNHTFEKEKTFTPGEKALRIKHTQFKCTGNAQK